MTKHNKEHPGLPFSHSSGLGRPQWFDLQQQHTTHKWKRQVTGTTTGKGSVVAAVDHRKSIAVQRYLRLCQNAMWMHKCGDSRCKNTVATIEAREPSTSGEQAANIVPSSGGQVMTGVTVDHQKRRLKLVRHSKAWCVDGSKQRTQAALVARNVSQALKLKGYSLKASLSHCIHRWKTNN